MSGGVDSAVALLRAGSGAVGVTLRLWQDPAAPDTERACCSPAAVAAARATCHALGLPHVTLDLREEFKSADRRSVRRTRYEAGETPNPCMRCNGAFRFDALVALRRACRSRRALDGPLRADRRARRPAARRARGATSRRTSRTCSRPSIRASSSGSASRSASRRRTRRAPRPRGRGSRPRGGREPGGVLPRRRRLPRVPRAPGLARGRGADRRRGGARARPARRLLAVHARASGAASGSRRPSRCTCCGPTRATNTRRRSGPRERARRRRPSRPRPAPRPRHDAEVKLRYRSPPVPARGRADGRRLRARARRARVRRGAAASSPSLYDDDVVVGAGRDRRCAARSN